MSIIINSYLNFQDHFFETIPSTTTCLLATCYLAYGFNWVVYKPTTTTHNAGTTYSFSINVTNQAKYDNATGIKLKGYAITRRILRTIYTYGGYNLNIALGASLTFTVNTYYIDATRIPTSTWV